MLETIASILIPMLPTLIQGVEKLFSAKPKSGTDKMATVRELSRTLLGQLQANGILPNAPNVSDDALNGIIESTFQQLKAAGAVQVPPAAAAGSQNSPQPSIFVVKGTIIPL